MSLSATQLEVRRQQRVVLRDVSLELGAGECVCLVGPNGAGKTSLLMTLAGLLPASSGAVRLDDADIRRRSRREIARRVAFVPQSYVGYTGFRVREVLEAARFAHRHALAGVSTLDTDAVAAQVAAAGLESLQDRTLDTLSTGERQKVWLAGALVQEAAYLLLDEPTAALDARHVAAFARLLAAQRQAGRGILMACHDLNLAATIASRIVALAGGHVVFDGPPADFFAPQRLATIYETPFRLAVPADGGTALVFPEC